MAKYKPTEEQLRAERRRDETYRLAAIRSPGVAWRGRDMYWNSDEQALEQERQNWVYEKLTSVNDLTVAMTQDPDREYRIHRQAFMETGDRQELELMLAYVRV